MVIQKGLIYGLRATSILTDIYETTRNEEEVKEVIVSKRDVSCIL